jgi:hypothetical protein
VGDDPATSEAVLRGASDGLLIAIREVDAKERQKRGVPPGDPGFGPLARDVVTAAQLVLQLALEEANRAELTSGRPAGAGLPTINASEQRANLASILEQWRTVERQLAAAEPASPQATELMHAFETLRASYARELERLKHDP